MSFRNSILAGEELVRSAIRSADYVAGVAGWKISRNGDAEFNDVTVRGTLSTGTGRPRIEIIPDDGTGTPVIELWPHDSLGPLDAPGRIFCDQLSGSLYLQAPDVTGGPPPAELFLVPSEARMIGEIVGFGDPDGLSTPGATVNAVPFDLFEQTRKHGSAPSGNNDLTSAAFAQWGPSTAVDVPTWATRATINVALTGIFPVSADWGGKTRVVLDGVAGDQHSWSALVAGNPRTGWSWNDQLTGFGTGAGKTLKIEGIRTSAGGAMRADTLSRFTYLVAFSA